MKSDKKELIFDAMEQLMSSVPYKDISVNTIAKKAGIGKGSIYYYFKSKDEILYAVIERSYRRAVHEYIESVKSQSEVPALEKIQKLFQSIIKKDFKDNEKNLIVTLHLNNDILLHNKMKYFAIQEVSPILTELLQQGIKEGSIKTDTPKESAEIIVAVLTFLLDDNSFPEDSVSMKNKLKIFAGVLEVCLKTEPGSFDFLYNMSSSS
ncbi:TetR/AcrR family transcriptional regulator [Porcipelethomonas sp.]|uniref:TetR/AcrR family transcriptional regulator n=1 Tax=Porcipelethomonas sp. TaxID=2981675 RepID=UPI003EF30ABB